MPTKLFKIRFTCYMIIVLHLLQRCTICLHVVRAFMFSNFPDTLFNVSMSFTVGSLHFMPIQSEAGPLGAQYVKRFVHRLGKNKR